LHEFAASFFVRTGSTNVMGTVLYDLWEGNGSYPQVAVMALLMVAITCVGVMISLKSGGTSAFSSGGHRG
jgi:iron(III) transport system permease protein